jgi:uncharacterized RDD family membrane protein YckC
VLDRVDVNRLLDRVDPDRLLDRVDADRLLDRVDADRLLERVDVNALVARTELGNIIARSTTGVFGQLLDVGRTGVMTVDLVAQGMAARLVRRREPAVQLRPDDPESRIDVRQLPRMDRAVALQGHYAGSVSRFLAFVVDVFLSGTLFSIGVALVLFALQIVTGVEWAPTDGGFVIELSYVGWLFVYFAVPTAVAGRTVGKAILGLFVVRADGSNVDLAGAALRTAAFPLSFLVLGIGFLLGLVRRDRRMLHDLVARTCVVYAWDAQVARLRSLSA